MQFSEDQAEAHDRISEILLKAGVDLANGSTLHEGGGKPGLIAVLGKAGSGKTMLLAKLVDELTDAGVDLISGD
ncbi:MAG: exodeoxyribonuclease-5, partial [Paracoccaceae bacterium]